MTSRLYTSVDLYVLKQLSDGQLTISEVAEMLNLSAYDVYRLADKKGIPIWATVDQYQSALQTARRLKLMEKRTMSKKQNKQRIDWGQVDGQAVYLYTLTNKNGLVAKITNYGTIITELHVPDRDGNIEDIVLGCADLDGYLAGHPHFGCTAGRVANRIANGRFTLDGVEYTLATNNGPNHLHGGEQGFDKKVWDVTDAMENSLKMTYVSVDGEEGYPGNLTTTVKYTLTDDDMLEIEMSAATDALTIVNLANHTYWNLAGHDSGNILGHVLVLNADNYTPIDETFIPTGEIDSVTGTPYDFTQLKLIGAGIAQLPGDGQDDPGGYDINFVLNGKVGEMKHVADVQEPNSGRLLEIYTTEPGVQFYSGNFLDGTVKGKSRNGYNKHAGFCLETQHYPDAINKAESEGWDSIALRPGETYRHEMVVKFRTQKVMRPEYMKAIAVIPGTPDSVHLTDLKEPSIGDLPKGRENLPKERGIITDGRGVLVQVLQCGVDGTDKEINDAEYGDSPPGDPFLVIGHENFGRVVEVGDKVTEFKPGDLVTATVRRPGGSLYDGIGQSDMTTDDVYYEHGINLLHGFLTEYYVEDPEFLVRVPPGLAKIGILMEPMSIVEKGLVQTFEIQRRLRLWYPKKAAVLGAGAIGQLATLVLRLKGIDVTTVARTVAPNAKSRLIEELDARYISSSEQTLDEITEAHGPFDIIFEATGSAHVAFKSMEMLAKNGVLILTSITGGDASVTVPGDRVNLDFVLGNKLMFGTVNAHLEYFELGVKDFAHAETEYAGWLEKLLTHPVDGLDNYRRMMNLLIHERSAVKVFVNVSE